MGMGMGRKIALVITTRSRPKYLAEAIDSVLAQTYQNWELVVWDDGSSSRVSVPKDARIRLISKACGRQRSLKAAIWQTDGEYLGWLDDDDRLHPEALMKTAAILNLNPQIGMVYTDHLVMDEAGVVGQLGARCKIPYSPNRMLTDFCTHHFRLVRRGVYDAVGGIDLQFNRVEDYDFCLKISEVTEVYHLKQPLYYYRSHRQMRSNQNRAEQKYFCKLAINNALRRRGMADTHRLSVTEDRYRIEAVL